MNSYRATGVIRQVPLPPAYRPLTKTSRKQFEIGFTPTKALNRVLCSTFDAKILADERSAGSFFSPPGFVTTEGTLIGYTIASQ